MSYNQVCALMVIRSYTSTGVCSVMMELCMEGVLSKGVCLTGFCPRGFRLEGVLSWIHAVHMDHVAEGIH